MARPTYLVAVSGGSVYIGYSPTTLTLTTSGTDVLEDTPIMDMQAAPASPNDSGDQQFHRHMYFCDGSNYVRLDAHTGEVVDWEAFRGTDTDTNETIQGVLPFAAARTDEIAQATASSNEVVVSGDQTGDYTSGTEVVVQNSSVDNDGSQTLSADSTYDSGNDQTTIPVTISDDSADGTISTVRNRCTMMCLYRNRIVMSGLPEQPSNWFMSAVGDPRNWEYSPPTTSDIQAVAGNVSEAGELGDAITALIPFSDDVLIFGCEGAIWMMTGDPAAGGTLDNVSQQIGIVGNDAWAFDSSNTLYFFGSDGLYRMAPGGGGLESVSRGRLDETFANIDYTQDRIILEWDQQRRGLYIFRNRDNGTNQESWFWDSRTDSFWPWQLPDSNGPQSAAAFDADALEDRTVILGGKDSYLRKFDKTRAADNNGADSNDESVDVAINSYVDIGPIVTGTHTASKLSDLVFTLSEISGNVDMEVRSGPNAEAAHDATARFKRVLNNGRNKAARIKSRGNAHTIRLSQNDSTSQWAYEHGEAYLTPAGRERTV